MLADKETYGASLNRLKVARHVRPQKEANNLKNAQNIFNETIGTLNDKSAKQFYRGSRKDRIGAEYEKTYRKAGFAYVEPKEDKYMNIALQDNQGNIHTRTYNTETGKEFLPKIPQTNRPVNELISHLMTGDMNSTAKRNQRNFAMRAQKTV
ncbi:MAG: hypothetical protein ACTSXQ_05045 [Alphaproteobacteria bacterium]